MGERVLLTIENHVATVTLNRPDKRKALDLPMFEAIAATGQALAQNPDVRAVVLRGAGEHFCAGIDVSVFGSGAIDDLAGMLEPREGSPANLFQAAAWSWREIPVPVICVISGSAFGGGLQVALGADLRFAHPDANFSVMEIKWGLIPDMAITATLLRLVATDKARELAWTGRVIGAAEAERIGLVTAVHADPGQVAHETAEVIAAQSPDAIRGIKRLFDEAPGLPVPEALGLEARLQLGVLGKANQVEAVRANFEGRAPRFGPPGADD